MINLSNNLYLMTFASLFIHLMNAPINGSHTMSRQDELGKLSKDNINQLVHYYQDNCGSGEMDIGIPNYCNKPELIMNVRRKSNGAMKFKLLRSRRKYIHWSAVDLAISRTVRESGIGKFKIR